MANSNNNKKKKKNTTAKTAKTTEPKKSSTTAKKTTAKKSTATNAESAKQATKTESTKPVTKTESAKTESSRQTKKTEPKKSSMTAKKTTAKKTSATNAKSAKRATKTESTKPATKTESAKTESSKQTTKTEPKKKSSATDVLSDAAKTENKDSAASKRPEQGKPGTIVRSKIVFTFIDDENEDQREFLGKEEKKPEKNSEKKPEEKPEEKAEEKPSEKPWKKFFRNLGKAEENPQVAPDKAEKETEEKAEKKPVEKPAEKAEKKTAEKPAEKAEKKPAEKPAEKAEKKPAEKPEEKAEKKPAEKPEEKAEKESAEKPEEKAEKEPTEKAEEKAGEKPEEKPVKRAEKNPKKKLAETADEVREYLFGKKPEINADVVYKREKQENRRKQKKKKKQEVTGFRRVLRYAIAAVLALLILVLVFVVAIVASTDPIDPENIYSHIQMSSILYDKNGHEIDRLHYEEDRERISINDISDNTKNAFIAIEDKTFYRHHGVNWTRIIGAVINKLLGKSDQISGTSTITQQLARNVFLPDVKSQRSLRRKLSEIVYAYQIEHALTKDEILEAYFNTIYLGYGCYGLESAAMTYFGKDAKSLTLEESAALAALPQAPDTYALIKDEKGEATTYLKKYKVYANDISKDRRNLVLDLMAEQGYITEGRAEKARVDIKDILRPTFDDIKEAGEYTYFSDYVAKQVAEDLAEEYKMSREEAERLIYTGGLYIYSTVDPEIQNIVNTEFEDDYNFPSSVETPQAAMVITDVKTGAILAMSGGRNTSGKRLFNRATSPRQPGSSVKPLAVYSAALQKSFEYAEEGETFPFINYGIDRQGIYGWGDYITAGSRVTDEMLRIDGKIWPYNFSRRFTGYKTFRTALQQSINTCAVKIQLQVGADYSVDMLKKYGISTVADNKSKSVNDYNPAALALGAMTYGCTPLDMALAYATFPNGGVRSSPKAYTKVLDANGKVILTKTSEKTKVLDEGVAWIMTDVLKSVVSRGIAGNARIYGVEVGGKTGTTNDTADIWFCGFTPKYSAALWIGTDQNTQMYASSSQAAALWATILRQIPDIDEGEYRPMPSNVVYRNWEYYTEGTEPGAAYKRY